MDDTNDAADEPEDLLHKVKTTVQRKTGRSWKKKKSFVRERDVHVTCLNVFKKL